MATTEQDSCGCCGKQETKEKLKKTEGERIRQDGAFQSYFLSLGIGKGSTECHRRALRSIFGLLQAPAQAPRASFSGPHARKGTQLLHALCARPGRLNFRPLRQLRGPLLKDRCQGYSRRELSKLSFPEDMALWSCTM